MAGCFVDTDKDGKFDAIAFPGHTVDKDLPQPVPYTLAEQVKVHSQKRSSILGTHQVEVLYQGVSKGEAKISYREFMAEFDPHSRGCPYEPRSRRKWRHRV